MCTVREALRGKAGGKRVGTIPDPDTLSMRGYDAKRVRRPHIC
jgi:hypothetical protein